MSLITRMKTTSRISSINICNGIVYLSGQVGFPDGAGLVEQAENMLSKVDTLLKEAGSSRECMLSAIVFLRDMKDFATFNEVWDAWVPEGHAPARACVEARMARETVLCEVCVIAAQNNS